MRSLASIAAGLLVGSALLTGCASSTGPAVEATSPVPAASAAPAQTKAEACEALGTSMDSAADTLNAAIAEFGSDPKKALKAMNEFTDSFGAAVATVTNPEVRAQGDKAVAASKSLGTVLESIINDPSKANKMKGSLKTFTDEITAIGTVCGG